MLKPLAILVFVLAAVAPAGCGGGTHNTYKDDFPPISGKIVALGQQVGKALQNAGQSTDRQLADDFVSYARELGGLQHQLDDLTPPKDLSGDHDRLGSAIRAVHAELDDIARAAEQRDPTAARDATNRLVQSSQKLRDARRKLDVAVLKL